MYLSTEECLAAIRSHTQRLADAAQGHLDAPIEHCPGWTMADLVWHLTSVHWFWNYVATALPQGEPDVERPARPADDAALVPGLGAGMETLVATLARADQDAPCWTWGLEENVRFITRHQVQEAAVHHWDAANAVGAPWEMGAVPAMDAVEEFLTHSVANRRWPITGLPPMDGTLWFCPCFAHDVALCPVWYIGDGEHEGTLAFAVDPEDDPAGEVIGHHVDPRDLLLWLYRRLPDEQLFVDYTPDDRQRAVIERFRAFTNTD